MYKRQPEEVKALLEQEGVKAEADTELPQVLWLQNMGNIEKLSAFSRGWFVVQDKSSVLAGLAAAPKPGSFCVDVCAAPGGKTLHLADQMRGSGLVESRDVSEEKCALIRENVLRCGFENVHISCWDAREFDGSLAGQADVLLADLPCSGLGILGGKPDIKYRMNEEKQESLVLLQREILEDVYKRQELTDRAEYEPDRMKEIGEIAGGGLAVESELIALAAVSYTHLYRPGNLISEG